MEKNGNDWAKLLADWIMRVVVVGFAGLTITGFFFLLGETKASDQRIEDKINQVDIQRQQTRERVAKLEECMLAVKGDIVDIKSMLRGIYQKVQ